MTPFTLISLILLSLVAIDSVGDAFRFKGYQIIAHSAEAIQIAGWIAFAGVFAFLHQYDLFGASLWEIILLLTPYAIMYVIGRIVLFDLIWNAITGHKILYIGSSDIIGIGIRAFARLFKQDYKHFSFIIKLMALAVWATKLFEVKLSISKIGSGVKTFYGT